MSKIIGIFGLLLFSSLIFAQQEELVIQTFRNTRIINSHSTETLKAGILDFRITHRFGDVAGDVGGWASFFGLENATDILIGLEYGLSDNVNIGLSRTKGAGPLKQNVNGMLKIKLINQERNGNQPLNLTVNGLASISTMQKSEREGVLHFFENSAHRWSYHLGMLLSKKISDYFSLQLNGAWTYRNIVSADDKNDLVSVGAALRINFNKAFGLLLDTTFPISDLRTSENAYYPAMGIGLEFDTSGGHVFQLNLTNATGIAETDYIPYTRTNWLDGEYRIGFTISRLFRL